MDGEFLRPVDPKSPEAQEALRALLGTTLAQLNEIDKNVVGSSSNIRGVKTDLKNVLQNINNAPAQVQQAPVPTSMPQPSIEYRPVSQSIAAPVNNTDKIDKIIELLEDIKALLRSE